jgi:hypothetical protein
MADETEERGKILRFTGITSLDMPANLILEAAIEEGDLERVVIMGYTKDGDEYFASSIPDAADVNWLCDRLKLTLLKAVDELAE